VKLRIVSLSLKSKGINAIVRQLQDEAIKIRRQTVARNMKRYNKDGSLADKPPLGCKPILTLEQMTFINEKMEANNELTTVGKNLKLKRSPWSQKQFILIDFNLQFQDSIHCCTVSLVFTYQQLRLNDH